MTLDPARPCPRCTFPLDVRVVGALEVDRCPRCHGTFVEHGEAVDFLGGHFEDVRRAAVKTTRSRLPCPLGHGPLTAHDVPTDDGAIEVDVCPTCAGLWLDQWEAVKLRRALAMAPPAPSATINQPPPGSERQGARWYLFQLFSGLPVEVWNPIGRPVIFVKAALVACIAVFVAQLAIGAPLVAGFALRADELFALQQPWTPVTYMFLHGGLLHLLGNLWFLHVFGDNVEATLGRRAFVALYVGAGVVGGLAHAAAHASSPVPLVGASGAIAGLMGAYLVLFPRVQVWVVWLFVRFKLKAAWYLGLWFGFQALLAALSANTGGSGTAFLAHVGGFVTGLAAGFVLRPRVRGRA